MISILVQPKIEHVAHRKIPLKRFRQLGTATRITSIILALLIVPSTITSAYIVQKLSEEYSLWESMQSNVSLAFSNINALKTDEMLPNVEMIFSDMKQKNKDIKNIEKKTGNNN